jgi:hypothetical protein
MKHPMCENCVHLYTEGSTEVFFCAAGRLHVWVSGASQRNALPRAAFVERVRPTGGSSNRLVPFSSTYLSGAGHAKQIGLAARHGLMAKTEADSLIWDLGDLE